ncbi:MAG: Gfo/Idh/MocA family oxidoreductase, partial [Lentisphaeria bacterium]|nr:Gfo/Idh/MocA family oxidoreductase [Lentisphaeria bacterium]
MEKTCCNVAFCGTGRWVNCYYIPELIRRFGQYRIAGFYDILQEKAQEASDLVVDSMSVQRSWGMTPAQHKERALANRPKVYASIEELIADDDVDVVVVVTRPVPSHFPVAMQLLEGGKNVVLEKPMTHSSAECDALIAKAKEKGVIFTVHHNLRYSTAIQAIKEVIRSGHVGEPLMIELHSPCHWYNKDDFSNFACHLTDQVLYLNQSPLKEVTATVANPADGYMGTAGYGTALLTFESGPAIRMNMLPKANKKVDTDEGTMRKYFRAYVTGSKDTVAVDDLAYVPQPQSILRDKMYWYDVEDPDFYTPEFLN